MTPFDLLQSLCLDRQTGMLFAVMNGNRQLRIGLVEGSIVHVTYALKRGPAAVDLLESTQAVTASFSPGNVSDAQAGLPPTSELLRRLQATLSSGAGAPPIEGARETAVPAPRREKPPSAHAASSAALSGLRLLLVEHIGPIGELLIDQEIENGFASWPELVETLAAEITPATAADAFRTAALRLHA